jgi:hypothetical protein
MLDDGLDGDARIHARQTGGQVADLRRPIGLAGLGQHDHVDVVGQVAQHHEILLVLIGAEGIDAHRHRQVVPVQAGQFPAQQIPRQGLLAATVFQVEQQGLGVAMAGVLLETLGGRLQILVQAQGRRVFHRRVVELDAGPIVARSTRLAKAMMHHRPCRNSSSLDQLWKRVHARFLVDLNASPLCAAAPHNYFKPGY